MAYLRYLTGRGFGLGITCLLCIICLWIVTGAGCSCSSMTAEDVKARILEADVCKIRDVWLDTAKGAKLPETYPSDFIPFIRIKKITKIEVQDREVLSKIASALEFRGKPYGKGVGLSAAVYTTLKFWRADELLLSMNVFLGGKNSCTVWICDEVTGRIVMIDCSRQLFRIINEEILGKPVNSFDE